MQNSLDMPVYVRAIVSEKEKEAVKKKQLELGLNEGQLIRRGLAKMGVEIESEKAIGQKKGVSGNPEGSRGRGKLTEELIKAIRADYDNKMSWKELSVKYGVSLRTISKALNAK